MRKRNKHRTRPAVESPKMIAMALLDALADIQQAEKQRTAA
jgi:hypothetical protein